MSEIESLSEAQECVRALRKLLPDEWKFRRDLDDLENNIKLLKRKLLGQGLTLGN